MHPGKPIEVIWDSLYRDGDTGKNQSEAHCLEEAMMLAELSPKGSGNGSGKAAQGKDEAGDEDEIWQVPGELGDICRHDWLQNKDDHLHQHAADQHISNQRNMQQRGAFLYWGSFCRGSVLACRIWRFLDKEDEHETVE